MNEDQIIEKLEAFEKTQDNVLIKIVNLEEKIDEIPNILSKLDILDTNVNNIVSTLDEIKGMFQKQDLEQTATTHALHRHEQRIERLEDVHNLAHTIT